MTKRHYPEIHLACEKGTTVMPVMIAV